MKTRFSANQVAELQKAKVLKIRAGSKRHRMIGIWMVLVGGRLFVRSWTVKPDGWFDTFLKERRGAILLNGRTVAVRGIHMRSRKLKDAVTLAYSGKYTRPGEKIFVSGFRTTERKNATLELIPV